MESTDNKAKLEECPSKNANFLSFITFSWVIPVFFKNRKKELGLEDLYQPLEDHKAENLGDKLCRAWEKQLKISEEKKTKPKLYKALSEVFWFQIVRLGVILLLMEIFLKLTQPFFLGKLISYYANEENSDISEAYIYSGAIVLTCALNVLTAHAYMQVNLHVGMKLRIAACSLIYRKSLRLSKNALIDTTSGQIVNLLSNDVGRLDLSVLFIHYLWMGPLETLAVLILMYQIIGVASVFGVVFLLSFIPLQIYLGKKTSQFRLKTALRTDERVRFMNEIVQGIQVIKMYAWEKPFAKLVSMSRMKEVKVIRYVSYMRGILLSFIMFTTRVSVFVSLIGFALLGNFVTAEKAFVITSYYNILRQTMTVFFPQAIGLFAEAIVSVKRLENYMMHDEIDKGRGEPVKFHYQNPPKLNGEKFKENGKVSEENHTTDESFGANQSFKYIDLAENEDHSLDQNKKVYASNDNLTPASLRAPGVLMQNVKAKWNQNANENTLDGVDMVIQPGTLALVMGTVGSGKSSLLQTILGELSLDSGKMEVNGTVSYASQEPWLFSGSVRQNILFGLPMDKERYRTVVKKCALNRDFDLFPNADKTIVGERGVSLSGGQRARINLARAIYRKADIYLLDDPLSAVDSHVSRHLFEQCIKEYLNDKIVILVTHQLQYLQSVDQIILLNHGKLNFVGTYESLQRSGYDVEKLLTVEEGDDENDESNLSRKGSTSSKKSGKAYKRQGSEMSLVSLEEAPMVNPNPMGQEEKRIEGSIGLYVYKAYCKAGGGYFLMFIVFMFFLVAQIFASIGDYFVSYWVNKEEARISSPSTADDTTTTVEPIYESLNLSNSTNLIAKALDLIGVEYDRNIDIYIFSGIIILTVVITLSRSFLFFSFAMRASMKLHDTMFNGISRATMFFFNTNPSGRILNRFSKDMGQIDEILPSIMIDVIQIFLSLIGIIVVISVVNQLILIPTVVIFVMFYFMRVFYLGTSRVIKRMEASCRSPIYSHLAASINGLSTIRAFNAEQILIKEFDEHQDLHSSAFYLFISTSRAFGFYLDVCCVFYIAIVTISFFFFENSGGNVGLAITQALGMTGMVQWGMRQSAELENTMTSVERVVEYNDVDPEAALESEPDKKPPREWPEHGAIKFDKLTLRYFPDPKSDVVLKELEFEIQPKEKIGIVGRTGAGKSSIINALFRLSYTDGSVIIDTRDTNSVGLHELRSKISIIPQEPVLFSGSLRYNLDPFDEYDDEKIWRALEEVELKEAVQELPAALLTRISEGGSNFSVGQRQLVCLARAILRENRILVMDEATANVDSHTDSLIQSTIRQKFNDCTVLTIAHRLNTVMDSDKILVMDAGKCVEFGSPFELLTKTEEPRVFHGMVKQTGNGQFDDLRKIAEKSFNAKKIN